VRTKLNVSDIRDFVADKVLWASGENKSGEEKHSLVVAAVVDWLDREVSFRGPLAPIAEAASDVVIRLLVGTLVQEVYDSLYEAGEV
jgi:hypothetical protein